VTDTDPVDPPQSPPLVHGGLWVSPNWTPNLANRLGSVRTDLGGVSEHWPRDLVPVMYPHIPNGFWYEVPETPTNPATGATAGSPGTFTPAGCDIPVTIEDMGGVVPDPTSKWDPGQYMLLSDNVTTAYWDSLEWVGGISPEPPPVLEVSITDINPGSGPRVGGQVVTITGTGFDPTDATTAVTFDTNPATDVLVIDPNTITCNTPPNTPNNSVDVTVTSAAGTDTLVDAYTYTPHVDTETPEQSQAPVEAPETAEAPVTTAEAPSASSEPTEAAPETAPDMTEYEMDQMWGIEGSPPETPPPTS
jgi:hypothetical protein